MEKAVLSFLFCSSTLLFISVGSTQVSIQLAAAAFTQEPDPYAVKLANIDDSTVLGMTR